MVLWAVGPARLDEVADRAAADRRHQGGDCLRRVRRGRPRRRAGGAGRRGGVRRRVRHRWGGAPRGAGGRRGDRRGARRRHRRALSGGTRRAVAPDRRRGTGGQRVSARGAACPAPVPDPQPAGRRARRGHRGRRGRGAQRCGQHRGVGRVRWAVPVCAVPGPVTSSASVGCHALLRGGAHLVTRAEDVVELVGRIGELAPDEHAPDLAARRAGRRRAAGVRRAARPAARAPSTRSRWPPACRRPQVLGPLAMLEVAVWSRRRGPLEADAGG